MTTRPIGRLVLASALALGTFAGAAGAQGSAQPLRGPSVDNNRVPGVEDTFSGMEKGGPKKGERGYPHKAFMDAIHKLDGDAAPAGLRLSEDQDKQISSLDEEFRKEARSIAEKNRGQKGAPPRPDGASPAPNDKAGQTEGVGPADKARPRGAARVSDDAFRAAGAKANEVHNKMWAVLSEPQQKFVDGELTAWRKEAEARRGEEGVKRRLKERGADGAKAPGAPAAADPAKPGAPAPGDRPGRERARRIMERLSQLSPEERDRILSRLEEELDKRLGAQKGKDGQKKPAPGLDGVDVPKPGDKT